ncbi:MAG: hypothetical protein ACI90V_003856, partial [Bacillariaceae sp.]
VQNLCVRFKFKKEESFACVLWCVNDFFVFDSRLPILPRLCEYEKIGCSNWSMKIAHCNTVQYHNI